MGNLTKQQREALRNNSKLRHDLALDASRTYNNTIVNKSFGPLKSQLLLDAKVKEGQEIQDYERISKGPRAIVSPGITQSVKAKIETKGGKRKIKVIREKLFSNSIPFGYTKKEWNERLRLQERIKK